MMKHEKYIESLLDLFLRGETTLEQEKELSEYFASSQSIPEEWEPYRQMFDYFDNGMPLEVEAKPRKNFSRFLWAMTATAAVVAILVMTLPNINRTKESKRTIDVPVITVKEDNASKASSSDTTALTIQVTPLIAKKDPKPVKMKREKSIVHHSLDSAELEREQGEIELAQQELMADKFIMEQERQEVYDEQYKSRAQAYQAKLATNSEEPHFIKVVFK